ncbi:CDP-glucose 4,6-dehydratase [Paenibacillus protaetiae]|uniref:CDP-glucose 4,6-dehydratase n=1 Tax=Paenibacillus protaetiae TaxID=2509456 RepID=A0A4P6ERA3_9BACL|nr:CDP-glucose 4,6-dehydratase [Paenibacillus protaetiae]QAY65046.1 CDP-glucose 4,6-dehydratase [Paenibacillus protaetiae]
MEEVTSDPFWLGKKVFLTGHTGFKGAWLSLWLTKLGASVTGYSAGVPTKPSLFELAGISRLVNSVDGDVRDRSKLTAALAAADPDIVIHMAAQPLVRESYRRPVDTYETNVLGTLYLLEAARTWNESGGRIKSIVNVTTDKCYDNKEWVWGYREYEPLGGHDPYSNSKACSELVTHAYRSSFFPIGAYERHGVGVATARAGNVIGGGDWAEDRLLPDCFRALLNGEAIPIRHPHSIRPWQHVLEPLSGYLLLAKKLYLEGADFAQSWNFGPNDTDARPVEWIVQHICNIWGEGASYHVHKTDNLHEAAYLKLDCSKAKSALGWQPRWSLETALSHITEWMLAYRSGENMRQFSLKQIEVYEAAAQGGSSL